MSDHWASPQPIDATQALNLSAGISSRIATRGKLSGLHQAGIYPHLPMSSFAST
jgi:hypothetical protein